MADEYITIPEMTEASISDIDDTSVVELAVVAQSESGYATRKSTLSTLSNYVLNKFSTLLLGGAVRTVKSAIDTIVSSMGDLTNLKTTAKTNLVDAINEAAESGGGSITVDSELSSTSENPVQNKIITNELGNKVNSSDLAKVAKSGSYDDLSNKPSIPTVDSELSETSQNPVQNNIITNALTSFANNLAQIIGTLDNKVNRSDLAEVATSGSYDDLKDKPAIPTKTSDIENDSGFITDAGVTSVNGKTGAVTGLQEKTEEITVSTSGAVTQSLEAGKIYHFTSTALTSLTVTLAATTELPQYHFDFISPATAATLSLPSTVNLPSTLTVEANKRYEIDILNNYGVVQSWDWSAA